MTLQLERLLVYQHSALDTLLRSTGKHNKQFLYFGLSFGFVSRNGDWRPVTSDWSAVASDPHTPDNPAFHTYTHNPTQTPHIPPPSSMPSLMYT